MFPSSKIFSSSQDASVSQKKKKKRKHLYSLEQSVFEKEPSSPKSKILTKTLAATDLSTKKKKKKKKKKKLYSGKAVFDGSRLQTDSENELSTVENSQIEPPNFETYHEVDRSGSKSKEKNFEHATVDTQQSSFFGIVDKSTEKKKKRISDQVRFLTMAKDHDDSMSSAEKKAKEKKKKQQLPSGDKEIHLEVSQEDNDAIHEESRERKEKQQNDIVDQETDASPVLKAGKSRKRKEDQMSSDVSKKKQKQAVQDSNDSLVLTTDEASSNNHTRRSIKQHLEFNTSDSSSENEGIKNVAPKQDMAEVVHLKTDSCNKDKEAFVDEIDYKSSTPSANRNNQNSVEVIGSDLNDSDNDVTTSAEISLMTHIRDVNKKEKQATATRETVSEVIIDSDSDSDEPSFEPNKTVTNSELEIQNDQHTSDSEVGSPLKIVGLFKRQHVKSITSLKSKSFSLINHGSSAEAYNTSDNAPNTVSRFSDAYVEGARYINNVLQKHPLLLNYNATKKQLDEAGAKFLFGPWTKYELQILNDNIQEYQRANNVIDFEHHYKMNKNTDLFITLGENINRPIRHVKAKLENMFTLSDGSERKGSKYTQEEIKKLIKLQKVHGNNWKLIGAKLGRHESSVRYKFSKIKGLVTDERGLLPHFESRQTFTHEEDRKIMEAIKKIATTSDGKIDSNKINWVLVSQHVGTRPANAIRQRWFRTLCNDYDNKSVFDTQESLSKVYKLKRTDKWKEISKRNKSKKNLMMKILGILVKSNITDPNDINWCAVAHKLEYSIDPRVLKQKFNNFLHKLAIPESKRQNYQDTLNYIMKRERLSIDHEDNNVIVETTKE